MLKSSGFAGRSDIKIDANGRLSIPAAFRKILAPNEYDEVVVVLVPAGHLLLFNKDYWSKTIQQTIIDKAQVIGKENAWRAIHRLSENSHMSTVDNQGRITIQSSLLQKGKITKNAVVIGAFDRVSVWAPDIYDKWINGVDVNATIEDMGLF